MQCYYLIGLMLLLIKLSWHKKASQQFLWSLCFISIHVIFSSTIMNFFSHESVIWGNPEFISINLRVPKSGQNFLRHIFRARFFFFLMSQNIREKWCTNKNVLVLHSFSKLKFFKKMAKKTISLNLSHLVQNRPIQSFKKEIETRKKKL